MITQEELKKVLNYNPDDGVFTWKISPKKNINIGDIAGYLFKGYIILTINSIRYRAHRLAFLYMDGVVPPKEVDHIDLNRSNNKWNNLRLATVSENQRNVSLRKDNKFGYKGVSLTKYGTYKACATLLKVEYYLGTYKDIISASNAYQEFAKNNHGKFYRKT